MLLIKKLIEVKEYEKKNSDIINEVRKSVGPKIKNAGENELPADLKDKDLIKSIVEEWLEKKKLQKKFFKKKLKLHLIFFKKIN